MAASDQRNGKTSTDDALKRATAAINRGRADEAEQIARGVLGKDGRHAGALRMLGSALLLQDRADDAVAPLESAARALRDPAVDTELAIALRRAGRDNDALSRLKRATKRRPPYAFAFHELGFLLFSLRRFDEAVSAVHCGMEVAPFMPDLPTLLGGILHARHDHAGAKAAYSRALSIAPDHPGARFGMGTGLMEQAAFAPAAEHFRFAALNNPNDLQVRLKLGACLLELGQTASALACLRAAVRNGAPGAYGMSLRVLLSSGRGRFWLQPSRAMQSLS